MEVKQYWQIYRHWLINIHKQRIYLCKHGFSTYEQQQSAENLLLLIEQNGYCDNKLMAAFILRKQFEIKQLIPQNQAYENQIEKLKNAVNEAKEYQVRNSVG